MGSILVATIVLYDLIHTRVAASVILMGMCRGMVYAVGAWSVVPTPDWHVLGWLATTLTLYTIVFSIVARSETQSQLDQRRWLAVLLPFIAIAPVVALHPTQWPWVIVPLALAFGWSARGVGMVFATPPRTRDAVMTWLAEICLVDALYLALLDRPIWALIAIGCFGLTVMGQRRISGA
jgi:4-hydroxybenzoate polyprenyltransferase